VVYGESTVPEQSAAQFIEALAGQAANAIETSMLFEDLQRSRNELAIAYDETIEGWSRALDLRDKETDGHSRRVTELTMRIARKMGVPSNQLQHMRRGALLHDIGKVGVPDSILLKPGALTDDEWKIMRLHTVYAFNLLSPIQFLRPAMEIPYCHHEKWDGTGYPRRLKGEQIPVAARIFAVADVWDAIRSDRPYRQAWSHETSLKHIGSLAGTHFDPKVVEQFLELITSDAADGTAVVNMAVNDHSRKRKLG
jgi:HD-GYP domain-containing protein (c-di-GMP phosphodiesterase class II)